MRARRILSEPDLDVLFRAAIQAGDRIILESTSPPGTTELVAQIITSQTGSVWTLQGFDGHASDALVDCTRFPADNVVVIGNSAAGAF